MMTLTTIDHSIIALAIVIAGFLVYVRLMENQYDEQIKELDERTKATDRYINDRLSFLEEKIYESQRQRKGKTN